MDHIMRKAHEMGFPADRAELIREKDGVTVARLYSGAGTAILKHFAPDASHREIENYGILAMLGVPSLRVLASCENAVVIEDMASEKCTFRPAEEQDMSDPDVGRRLAAWYRKLHDTGFAYVKSHGDTMYSETSLFTRENIENVRIKSGTSALKVWDMLDSHYDKIMRFMASLPMTLTYNDFYYTNMAVARDRTAAIMFDYNLLGKGHVYSDIRNVEYSLSPEAAAAFREAYGEYDFSDEAALDAVVSPIVTLHFAYAREIFPAWAQAELDNIKTGYIKAVEALETRLI